MSKTNIENRKQLKNPHTVGKIFFAIVRNELEKEKNTSDPLSLREFFVATRSRKPGRSYNDSDEDTTSKLAEMEKIEAQQSEDGSNFVNAFAAVMGPEHSGRLRLYERGVTRTSLKGKMGHFEPSSHATNNPVQQMEERMVRMFEEQKEQFEKQKEEFEKQKEQYEEQKRMMRQEILGDIVVQFQRSGLPIDPTILATLCGRSSGEASSAQQDQKAIFW
ncbi:uncharacterized protein LOC107793573 [Nicotiana tabacum]|uniref:Uncharacterized protein isoform X1 n=1 Tax=Nicotiana tabacum TaxID=4097 RepID=A0A1S4A498_TOBAC|nr:PREDICTED: uncharacterized protein LOC107793573 isoform X1 [Nicotiana tabacum]